MFQKRLEMETRNVVRRDLEMFDAKFASGGDALTRSIEAADTQPAGTPSSSMSDENSDTGRHRGSGEPANKSQDSLKTGAVHTLSGGLAVPSRSFQFQADWKQLKNHPEELYAYFKVITNFDVAYC